MKLYHCFRHFCSAIALSGMLFFAVSCSDQPAPGPMSPENSNKGLVSEQNRNSTGEVRPLNRQNAVKSLAKLTTYDVKAVLHLQDLYDEVKYIETSKPGTTLASKMNAVAYKIWEAQDDLNEVPPDNGALSELAIAKSTLQSAINNNLLNPITGNQFINEIKAVEAIINAGGTINHDCRGTTKYLWMKKCDGGLIAHCGHKVVVPKNALKTDAPISISINSTDYIKVDFGPDGWFNSPVTVNVSYRDADLTGINVNNLTVAWYDTATGKWIDLGGTVDTIAKIVKVLTDHFTEYTISTR